MIIIIFKILKDFYISLKMLDNSFYLIPNEYVPVLVKKSLFKNSEKAVKIINGIQMPMYILDDFCGYTKRPPNAFILFRNEVFKKVKLDNPNNSSRELSKIIGDMWKQMSKENKLPYHLKANEMSSRYSRIYPRYKYKKVLSNLKKREYYKKEESNNNSYLLWIKKLLS